MLDDNVAFSVLDGGVKLVHCRRMRILSPCPMIDVESIPAAAGAYALLIRLPRPWSPGIRTLGDHRLQPGLYAYCGNARGAGGLRARVARHLRRDKAVRWHVDRLTAAGEVATVAFRLGGYECDLVSALMSCGAAVALPGFGSSDCRRCPAHLLRFPANVDAFPLAGAVELGPGTGAPL